MAVYLTDEQDVPVDHEDLVALARLVVREQRVPEDMELSLLLVDEGTIAAMNHKHMGKRGPTDVLAFPIDLPGETPPEIPAVLGDVMLCPTIAARQGAEAGHGTQAEVQLLTAHGILHLLGWDHHTPDDEQRMFGRTDELLQLHRADR